MSELPAREDVNCGDNPVHSQAALRRRAREVEMMSEEFSDGTELVSSETNSDHAEVLTAQNDLTERDSAGCSSSDPVGGDPSDEDSLARELAKEVFGERFALADEYVTWLRSEGVLRGLIGPREADRLWSRHILNSVASFQLFPIGARVADVGSGAGLPGIPLAIIRPDLEFTLIESMLRRTTFLSEVIAALGLESQVKVLRARAEEVPGRFDVVTARAVAPLEKLLGWTTGLFLPDGELLALKGETAADEVAAAQDFLSRKKLSAETLTVRALPQAEPTHVVRIRAAR